MNTHDADGDHAAHACARHPHADTAAIAKDPVCGMTVDPGRSAHHARHDGIDYHFCHAGCRTKFLADPERYLSPAPASVPDAPPGTIYICPMDPQIRQEGPGTCPICGMALEPEMPSLEETENPELTDFTRRFWWTLPLTVVVMVLAMWGHHLPALSTTARTWI